MTEQNLLIDEWGSASNQEALTEARDGGKGALYITGIFMQANVRNKNGRIYPKRILAAAVDKYIEMYINNPFGNQALGELNHPPRPMPDPLHTCIVIESLWWDGDNVMGRARVVEGDYGVGDKVAALIRAGWVPGVSSRGLGSVRDGYVQEGYTLTVAADVVWGPSAPSAYVKPSKKSLNESVESGTPVSEAINTTTMSDEFSKLIENLKNF